MQARGQYSNSEQSEGSEIANMCVNIDEGGIEDEYSSNDESQIRILSQAPRQSAHSIKIKILSTTLPKEEVKRAAMEGGSDEFDYENVEVQVDLDKVVKNLIDRYKGRVQKIISHY
jgi:hypothetical protein